MNLVTHQTGPAASAEEGACRGGDRRRPRALRQRGHRQLYRPAADDGLVRGGVEIEEVAARDLSATALARRSDRRLQPFQGRQLAMEIGLSGDLMRPAANLMAGLYKLFEEKDCTLAEVNPLVVTKDGRVLAADAKLNFDDNALYRHKDVGGELRDLDEEDPSRCAQESGVGNYVKLTGNIGCIVNGAGSAMATMDAIKLAGGDPANFLDIGTVNAPRARRRLLRIITEDPAAQAILINIFGGMARVDVIAQGIIEAQGSSTSRCRWWRASLARMSRRGAAAGGVGDRPHPREGFGGGGCKRRSRRRQRDNGETLESIRTVKIAAMVQVKLDDEVPSELLDCSQALLSERDKSGQIRAALAIHLFVVGDVSLGRAAELAGEPRVEFMKLLGELGIPAVTYGRED